MWQTIRVGDASRAASECPVRVGLRGVRGTERPWPQVSMCFSKPLSEENFFLQKGQDQEAVLLNNEAASAEYCCRSC